MLDSSFCIDVMREKMPVARQRFKANSGAMALSTVALHELFYGAANAQQPAVARQKVEEFAGRMTVVYFDMDAASHAGDIRATLRRLGQTIGPYDTLIAAHARCLGLMLVTSNTSEFARVSGLMTDNWLMEEST